MRNEAGGLPQDGGTSDSFLGAGGPQGDLKLRRNML